MVAGDPVDGPRP